MRTAREKFIADIAGYVKKYAGQYGILVYSPVIAQAVLESGWGESRVDEIVGSLLLSVEKSADDGRLIFLFEVSNFYVTNITVCAIIKTI